MVFSSPFKLLPRSALTSAVAIVVALSLTPAASFAHESKASVSSAQTSGQSLQSQKRSDPQWKEIKRGNAYAPTVWMPEAASGRFAGSDVSFGLARLNPLVRRSVGVDSGGIHAVAPVMSMQVSPTSSVTFIKIVGDSSGAMVAWQLKL